MISRLLFGEKPQVWTDWKVGNLISIYSEAPGLCDITYCILPSFVQKRRGQTHCAKWY